MSDQPCDARITPTADDDDDLALLIEQSVSDTRIIQAFRELARMPDVLEAEMRAALERVSLPA